MFISDNTSRFRDIVQIVPRCTVLYDCLWRQRVFTAKNKWWQPDCFVCCRLSLDFFGHSKARKWIVHQASKGAFVVVFWIRIRMWWRMWFLVLLSQNASTLCWAPFLALFQPQAGAVDLLCPFKVEERSGQPCV